MNNIKKLISMKYHFTVRPTLTKGIYIKDIVNYFYKTGIKNIIYAPSYKGVKNIDYSNEDYKNLFKYLNYYSNFIDLNNNKKDKSNKYNLMRYQLKEIIKLIHLSKLSRYNCGAGMGYVSIDVDGNICSCQRFTGIQDYKIGDIFNGIDYDKRYDYYIYDVNNNKKCSNCWARYLCGGTCYYGNYIFNNSKIKINEFECKYKKKLINISFRIYLKSIICVDTKK